MRFVRSRFAIAGRVVPLPSPYAAMWWALAATITLLVAAIFWALVTPAGPLGNWRPASVRLVSPAARAALFASVDPFNRGEQGAVQASANATVTALSLTLYGTRSTQGGQGTAIIAGPDGLQQVFRTGSEVMPGVTLAEVAFDHVVLSRSGSREMLYIDQSQPAPSADSLVASPGGAAPAAPSAPLTVDAARKGIAFAPHAEEGRVMGLEVQATGDAGAFRSAGFQPGDVITAIDGKPVSGAADAAAIATRLKPGASIPVIVRRGGTNFPLAVTLAP